MVRLAGAAFVTFIFASTAAAEDYIWLGKDHACVVETGTGLIAGETKSPTDAAFRWTGAPKGFRLQATWCDAKPVTQTGWPECSKPDELALRTPNFLGRKHVGWSVNKMNSFAFSSADGYEMIVLSKAGTFNFAMFGNTANDAEPAWFTMTGTCTPFDE